MPYLDPPIRQWANSPTPAPAPGGASLAPYSPGPLQSGPIQGELLDPAPGYNPPKGNVAPPPVLDGELIQPKANRIPRPSSIPGPSLPRPSVGGIPARYAGPAGVALGAGLAIAQGADPGQVVAGLAGGALGAAVGTVVGGPWGAALGGVLGQALGEKSWNSWYAPQHTGRPPQYRPAEYSIPGLGRAGAILTVRVSFKIREKVIQTGETNTYDLGTGQAVGVAAPFTLNVASNSVSLTDATGRNFGLGGRTKLPGTVQTVIDLVATSQEESQPPQPIEFPDEEYAEFSPFSFVLPTQPGGGSTPYREPRPFNDYSPYDYPDPSPSPVGGPSPTPNPIADPVPLPVSDPSPTPTPDPSPTPTPGPGGLPGGLPGGSPTGAPAGGGGGGAGTGSPGGPIQTPPPDKDCCCPPIPEFECKFKAIETENIFVKLFDKCVVNADTGKKEPTYKFDLISVPKMDKKVIQLKFERIAEIESLQCSESKECVAAVPDWWQVRPGAGVSQLVIQYYNDADAQKVPKYVVTVPHPKSNLDLDDVELGEYRKGNWMGILTLVDNSKLIVNCESIAEAERVIQQLSSLIDESYLTGLEPKVGKRGGQPLLEIKVKPKILKLFPTGQRNLAPSKVRYLSES